MHPLYAFPDSALVWLRPKLLPVFKSSISKIAFPVFVGVPLALALSKDFYPAYAFWIFCGAWAAAWWLISDFIHGMRPHINRSAKRQGNAIREWKRYSGWQFIGMSLIAGATAFCFLATRVYELNYERDDVWSKLQIIYAVPKGAESDPFNTVVTIKNGSKFAIGSKHRTACFIHAAVVNDGTSGMTGFALAARPDGTWDLISGNLDDFANDLPDTFPINGGDDAESSSCLTGIKARNYQCVDMAIWFQYLLADQPTVPQVKKKRVVTRRNSDGGLEWFEKNIEAPGTFCAQELKRQR